MFVKYLCCFSILCLVWLTPSTAAAQSINCNGSVSDIAFGTVSLRSGEVNETSGTLSINCTGIGTIGVCVYFGAGSGGSGPGFSPRFMRRADNTALSFELRPNGNGPSGGTWDAVFVQVPTVLGGGAVNVPVFADITSTGTATGIGAYATTFTGTGEIRMEFNTASCAQAGTVRDIGSFTVSATVAASCEVDAGSLDFGTFGPDTPGDILASTTFLMRCTQGTGYEVRLGNGMGAGASGPTDRRMTGPAAQLRYGLYLNAARTQPWGETPGTTASSVGTGSDQGMTVHGIIFGGQPLLAGTYSDSVLVTVEY